MVFLYDDYDDNSYYYDDDDDYDDGAGHDDGNGEGWIDDDDGDDNDIVDIDNGALIGKTTGKGAVADPAVAISYQMHDVPVMFKVYSRQIGSRNWDAKTASIQVAARVKEVFGGHPTSKPVAMSMDPGSIVLQRFERDYGSRLDENVHCWHLEYLFKIDNQFAH